MDDEYALRVGSALLKALEVVPTDGMQPTPVVAMAACLQQLAVGRGLAQRKDPNQSPVRSAALPEPALAYLDSAFDTNGETASDDDVRNGLYGALVALSESPKALRSINKNRALSADDLLMFAQIYWNLDAERPRTRLPIPVGQKLSNEEQAYIKVDGVDADYAELDLKQRANRTPGYATGAGAFYERGARIAALVAQRLLDGPMPQLSGAQLRSTPTGRGTEWAIVWPIPTSVAPKPPQAVVREKASTGAQDPMIGNLRQLRETSMAEGRLGEAAILCTALISILKERSARYPGDHESQLAAEYLQSGLASTFTGRSDEALEHFLKSERVSQTLSDLDPDETMHRLQLAVARTMIGILYLSAARMTDAEVALNDAVALSQALTDENASNEDLLAVSLGMLSILYLQTGQPDRAMTALTRAVKISQKIVRQNPDDQANQLQLANTLATLGMLHFQNDDEQQAEECVTRSLSILDRLAQPGSENHLTRLIRVNDRFLLGNVFYYSARYEEAEAALTAATSLARELIDQYPGGAAQLALAGALHTLGLLYGVTGRENDCENAFVASVAVSRELVAAGDNGFVDPSQLTQGSLYLGSALYYLGLLDLELERDHEGEAWLLEAVRVFEQRANDADDQKMLSDALESLADLYRRRGRDNDAERIRNRLRRLDDQSPDTPAMA